MKLYYILLILILCIVGLSKGYHGDELEDCLEACRKEDNLYIQDICDHPNGTASKRTPMGRFAANQLKNVCDSLSFNGKINFGHARLTSSPRETLDHCMYAVCFNGVPLKPIEASSYAPPTRPTLFSN